MESHLSLLMIAVACCSVFAAEPIYQTDFETDPVQEGWVSGKGNAAQDWREGEAASGRHSLDISRGGWQSPKLSLMPNALYALRVKSKATHPAYWGIRSFTAEDVSLGGVTSGIYRSTVWREDEFVTITPLERAKGGYRIVFWPIEGEVLIDDVSLTPITSKEALRIADRQQEELPKLNFDPDPERWTNLANTMKLLQAGRPLRWVVLGDSVANDLATSLFHMHVERLYPGASITLANSVAGNAGSEYYLEGDRLQSQALKYEPDLVIIAGISHGRKTGPVRELVRRVRQKSSAEVLMVTGQWVNAHYWKRFEEGAEDYWTQNVPIDEKWRADLARTGREDGFCVFNFAAVWDDYIRKSGKPIEWFRRDTSHVSDRGKQVAARIMAAFFKTHGNEKRPVVNTGAARGAGQTTPETRNGPDLPVVAEIVGTIVRVTEPLTAERAEPYLDAYFHVEYRVEQVPAGELKEEQVLTVQQCLKDRKPLPSAKYKAGLRHRLVLTRWNNVPKHDTFLIAPDREQDLDDIRYFPLHLQGEVGEAQ